MSALEIVFTILWALSVVGAIVFSIVGVVQSRKGDIDKCLNSHIISGVCLIFMWIFYFIGEFIGG